MKKLRKIFSGSLVASALFLSSLPSIEVSAATEANEGNYVVISNESLDYKKSQFTGDFDYSQANSNITFDKNLDLGAYQVDANLPFDAEKYKSKALNKTKFSIAKSYEVGDTKHFWVTHMSTDEDYQILAKLMYSGTKANVWVHNNEITKEDAEKLGEEFDEKIYPVVVNNFAEESDVDGDGKINILCFDIQDDFDTTGVYTGGYFYSRDLFDITYSNRSEIFYMDTYPSMGTGKTKYVERVYSTLAHEFQHMVNFNQNAFVEDGWSMDTWLNEALSMAAEQIYLGQALSSRISYYNLSTSIKNGHPLMNWGYNGDSLSNYSLSYLFAQYIKLQADKGNSIFKEIIEDDEIDDAKAIENIIKKYIDSSLTFEEMLTNFRLALLLNQPTGLYGFKGDSDFDSIQPRLYTNGPKKLVGSGAIAMKIDTDNFTVPTDKGENVTYTFVQNGEVVNNGGAININVTSEVSDQDEVVKGTTAPNADVFVEKSSTAIYSNKADNKGNFEVIIPKQPAGTELTVYSKDSTGKVSKKVKITVVDKTAPAKPTVNTVGDNDTQVTGKAEAGSTVYVMNGNVKVGEGTANENGDFTVAISKQKVGTTLTIYAQDAAGNKSEAVTITVVDKTAPIKPTVYTVADNTVKVTGKAEAGSTVYVLNGNVKVGEGTANKNGDFTVAISKQKAGTILTIYAQDAAGNKSEAVSNNHCC